MISLKLSLKKIAYIVCFFALASVFALIYYGSYYYALNNMKSDNIITKDKIISNNPGVVIENESTGLNEVNAGSDAIVLAKMQYVEETYNLDTDTLTKDEQKVPVELLGFNRDQIIDYLGKYKENNKDESLVNIQLVSFSDQALVVRKTVRDVTKIYNYYVISRDNTIKIYQSDKKTLYIDTGITVDNLDDEHKTQLENGFYIESVHELYNYLESLTS